MGAEPARLTEHLTLARAHAVVGTLSAVAVIQLVGVNPLPQLLKEAVGYFAAALLFSGTAYILETDRSLPRLVHFPKLGRNTYLRMFCRAVIALVSLAGFGLFLSGLGRAVANVDELMGEVFKRVGGGVYMLLTLIQLWQIWGLPEGEYPAYKDFRDELLDIDAKMVILDSVPPEEREAARSELVARREIVMQKLEEAYERFTNSPHLVWFPRMLK